MNWNILLILLLLSIQAKAQLLNSETLYNKVVLLKEQLQDKEIHGTGFILKSDNNSFFLVTARHVADNLHTDITEIFFRDSLEKAVGYKLKQFIPKIPMSRYNDESDFFILRLDPFDVISKKLLQRSSFDIKLIANDRTSIDRKYEVVVFGYPIFDFEHFNPITFKSNFSSGLINIKIEGLKKPCYCYLLENPSMEGFSGGPVFFGVQDRMTYPANATLIIGLVTATTYDKTGGKFAVITPTFHLLDLVNK
jgi:hypothetical protein